MSLFFREVVGLDSNQTFYVKFCNTKNFLRKLSWPIPEFAWQDWEMEPETSVDTLRPGLGPNRTPDASYRRR